MCSSSSLPPPLSVLCTAPNDYFILLLLLFRIGFFLFVSLLFLSFLVSLYLLTEVPLSPSPPFLGGVPHLTLHCHAYGGVRDMASTEQHQSTEEKSVFPLMQIVLRVYFCLSAQLCVYGNQHGCVLAQRVYAAWGSLTDHLFNEPLPVFIIDSPLSNCSFLCSAFLFFSFFFSILPLSLLETGCPLLLSSLEEQP